MAGRRSGWLTPAEYARHRRVSRQAVHKAIGEGRIPLVSGRIDRETADRDWQENSEPPAGSGAAPPGPEGATFNQARTLLQIYRARRERIAYEREIGKSVDADEVLQAFHEYGRRVQELLMSVPARLAPQLVGKSRAKCEQLLLKEVRHTCEELAAAAERASAASASVPERAKRKPSSAAV